MKDLKEYYGKYVNLYSDPGMYISMYFYKDGSVDITSEVYDVSERHTKLEKEEVIKLFNLITVEEFKEKYNCCYLYEAFFNENGIEYSVCTI